MFADAVPTRHSLNSVISLDMDHFRALGSASQHMFRGVTPGPLYALFRHNGYEISTGFRIDYFGIGRGPHIDHYLINSRFAACTFVANSINPVAFLGFCSMQKQDLWKEFVAPRFQPESDYIEAYQKALRDQRAASGRPQLAQIHIYHPGHTEADYDPEDRDDFLAFRDKYAADTVETQELMKRMMAIGDDPARESVFFFFGDHGSWISRGMRFMDDPQFVFLDRFGIYGGIHPKDFCADRFSRLDDLGFATPIRVVTELTRCLAGDEDPFISEPTHGPWAHGLPDGFRYEDFLYE
jgi:hypothetical protein